MFMYLHISMIMTIILYDYYYDHTVSSSMCTVYNFDSWANLVSLVHYFTIFEFLAP